MKKKILTLCFLSFAAYSISYGQTTLSEGDVIITSFNSDSNDEFSFVILKATTTGTTIYFTENGWDDDADGGGAQPQWGNTSEGTLTWTSTSNLSCGVEVQVITPRTTQSASTGTLAKNGSWSLSSTNDSVIAYQGTGIPTANPGAPEVTTILGGPNALRTALGDASNYDQGFFNENYQAPGCVYDCDATTWDGDTGTDWATTNNWSDGVPIATTNIQIPNVTNKPVIGSGTSVTVNNATIDASSSLTINAGGSLTADNDLTNNGTLTINSDASANGSLIVNGTSAGNITYNRYVTTNATSTLGWHLVGSPVVGETIEDIISNGSLAVSTNVPTRRGLAIYDNNQNDVNTGGWVYQTTSSTGTMNSGTGYAIKRSAAGTVPFTGTVKTDDLSSFSITVGSEKFWNLVGNPYPSFLNATTAAHATNTILNAANLAELDPSAAGIYLWDSEASGGAGEYVIINNMGGAIYIAPGQSFFLAAKAGGGSINITEAMQTHRSEDWFARDANIIPQIALQISDGTVIRKTEIKYSKTKVTNGLDPGYDARRIDIDGNDFAIYSHLVADSRGIDFMLQALPDSDYENTVIPIGVNAGSGTEITFTATALNIPDEYNVYLEDRKTNTIIRLDEANSSYAITASEGLEGIGRFYLHTSTSSLSIENSVNPENISIYKTDAFTLRMTGLPQGNTIISIYNIVGQEIMRTSFHSTGVTDISLPELISGGIYMVQLETKSGKVNKKIILE